MIIQAQENFTHAKIEGMSAKINICDGTLPGVKKMKRQMKTMGMREWHELNEFRYQLKERN